MSNFTVGLAILGGLVLAAMVIHSTLSARRQIPKRASVEPAMTPPPVKSSVVTDLADEPQRPGAEPATQINRTEAPITDSTKADASVAGSVSVPAPASAQTQPHARDNALGAGASLAASLAAPGISTGTVAASLANGGQDAATPSSAALHELPPSLHRPMAERQPNHLDVLIDVIAPITFEEQVSGDAVLAAMPPTRRAGTKPFGVEGLNAATQIWEAPQLGQRYAALQAGVQLANRSGALNEIEYSEFVMKAQAFADALDGTPEFPEMLEEVARARELDQFASNHDAQLSFTLRTRSSAWSPGFVQQHASRHGFVPGTIPGRMVLPAKTVGLPAVLTLTFDTQAALAEDPDRAAVREVTLSLDVGQVDRQEKAFARLCEVSQQLATSMEGVVTDDRGQALRPEAMTAIEADIQKLYDALDAHDISAGSLLARRLFS